MLGCCCGDSGVARCTSTSIFSVVLAGGSEPEALTKCPLRYVWSSVHAESSSWPPLAAFVCWWLWCGLWLQPQHLTMHPHYLLEQRRRPEHLLLQQDKEYYWLILDLLLVDLQKLCNVSLQAATSVQDLLGYS